MDSQKMPPNSEKEKIIRRIVSTTVYWHIANFDRDVEKLLEEENCLVKIQRTHPFPETKIRFYFTKSESACKSWNEYNTMEHLNVAVELVSPEPAPLSFTVSIEGTCSSRYGYFTMDSSKPTATVIPEFVLLSVSVYTDNFQRLIKKVPSLFGRPTDLYLQMRVELEYEEKEAASRTVNA